MTIYYTAKDIEEMAAKGIRQIEIGPGITLTDFARETARQLDIALVAGGKQTTSATPAMPAAPPASPSSSTGRSSKYNKPSGCMHGSPTARPQAAVTSPQSVEGANANTVNRLIDLMGRAVKRGG